VKSLVAMAFIPAHEVLEQFNRLERNLPAETLLLLGKFIVYFRSTWLDGIYPIAMWNKYGKDHLHR